MRESVGEILFAAFWLIHANANINGCSYDFLLFNKIFCWIWNWNCIKHFILYMNISSFEASYQEVDRLCIV